MLDVRGLCVSFAAGGKRFRVVDGVSFDLARGQTLGVVGESGCGKTVTALSILRLIDPPGRIEAGAVRFGGRDLLDLPESAMRRIRGARIAMIFQEPMSSLNPALTVREQVVEAARAHGAVPRSEVGALCERLLAEVGVPDPARRLSQYPFELSGGIRQRVMIAGALACEPEVLVADEPTTALDVTVQAQILELLARIREAHGTSVLLITHNLGAVAAVCDRVVVMYAGRVVEVATTDVLFAEALHPYTRALLRSVPRLDSDRAAGGRLAAIGGTVPMPSALPPGCKFEPRCPCAVPECAVVEPDLLVAGEGHLVRCPVTIGASVA